MMLQVYFLSLWPEILFQSLLCNYSSWKSFKILDVFKLIVFLWFFEADVIELFDFSTIVGVFEGIWGLAKVIRLWEDRNEFLSSFVELIKNLSALIVLSSCNSAYR